MLQYHYNSLSKALVELFPDIGINRNTLKGIESLFLFYFLSRFVFLNICFRFVARIK